MPRAARRARAVSRSGCQLPASRAKPVPRTRRCSDRTSPDVDLGEVVEARLRVGGHQMRSVARAVAAMIRSCGSARPSGAPGVCEQSGVVHGDMRACSRRPATTESTSSRNASLAGASWQGRCRARRRPGTRRSPARVARRRRPPRWRPDRGGREPQRPGRRYRGSLVPRVAVQVGGRPRRAAATSASNASPTGTRPSQRRSTLEQCAAVRPWCGHAASPPAGRRE